MKKYTIQIKITNENSNISMIDNKSGEIVKDIKKEFTFFNLLNFLKFHLVDSYIEIKSIKDVKEEDKIINKLLKEFLIEYSFDFKEI